MGFDGLFKSFKLIIHTHTTKRTTTNLRLNVGEVPSEAGSVVALLTVSKETVCSREINSSDILQSRQPTCPSVHPHEQSPPTVAEYTTQHLNSELLADVRPDKESFSFFQNH